MLIASVLAACASLHRRGRIADRRPVVASSTERPQPQATRRWSRRRARIHDRVITLDTHDDISPDNFTPERNYTQDLPTRSTCRRWSRAGSMRRSSSSTSARDRLTPEGYDGAYKQAIDKFDAIHRLTKEIAPDKIGLALTAADVRRINKAGKKVALIGVENGYPLGDETTAVERVKEFHDRGARYLSLAHNGHSQLADSNTGEASGEWLHNGLSALGKQVIAELNRVGIMVDISHPSKEGEPAGDRALEGAGHRLALVARALCDHSRNLDDEQLLALKKNGGVVQAVAFANYVKTPPPPSPERTAALAKLEEEYGLPAGSLGAAAAVAVAAVARGGRGGRGAPAGAGAAPRARSGTASGRGDPLAQLATRSAPRPKKLDEMNAKFPPPPRANVKDFVDHIDYIVKKIGIDHVGISSDFDGGGGVDGWNDASETFNVTLELVRRGYTEEQIGKIWSGNLLRVMDEVQKVARKGQPQRRTIVRRRTDHGCRARLSERDAAASRSAPAGRRPSPSARSRTLAATQSRPRRLATARRRRLRRRPRAPGAHHLRRQQREVVLRLAQVGAAVDESHRRAAGADRTAGDTTAAAAAPS